LHALREAGLSIPQDMALIGFHDFELASDFTPPLTVVKLSPEDMSTRAMALLIDRIKRKRDQQELPPAKVVMPTTLIVRSSCGCNPKSVDS
jgi:LacI family transcriptional regulator